MNGNSSRGNQQDGGRLEVRIQPGGGDGQVLRRRGKGAAGPGGGPAGEALSAGRVTPDPDFTRDGADLRETLPIDLKTAVLGGSITVPTPSGAVRMNVPAGSDSGSILRLRGKGVQAHGTRAAGNLYVTLQVKVGKPDAALEAFLKSWTPAQG